MCIWFTPAPLEGHVNAESPTPCLRHSANITFNGSAKVGPKTRKASSAACMQNLLIPRRFQSVSRGYKRAKEQEREERKLNETQAAAERKETTGQDEEKRFSSRRIPQEEMSTRLQLPSSTLRWVYHF
jgi:hypothetical protein